MAAQTHQSAGLPRTAHNELKAIAQQHNFAMALEQQDCHPMEVLPAQRTKKRASLFGTLSREVF